MSRRSSIVKALAEKFKLITVASGYKTDLATAAFPYLKFWDEVNNFPSVYVTPGSESREYLPSNFTWGYLGISVKLYTKGEEAQQDLEDLLEDVERVVNENRVLLYDVPNNLETTDILVTSIVTDEGILAPYAVGEINLSVRYAIMQEA